jgi:hypothetical protein
VATQNSGAEINIVGSAYSDLSNHSWAITQKQEAYVTRIQNLVYADKIIM